MANVQVSHLLLQYPRPRFLGHIRLALGVVDSAHDTQVVQCH